MEPKSRYFNDIVTKIDKIAEVVLISRAKEFGFTGIFLKELPLWDKIPGS
ncbi:MAG: hypothetical protein HYY22_05355 [Thaumarchaeota archaeon]|nr:hypothetical protein [Nitrososphaerota archaeon]